MKIGIDVFPETLIPSKVSSYASKSVMTLLFDPIYSSSTSRGICQIQQVGNKFWKIRVKERYWSNGEVITASDIINTFIFYIEANLSISKELDIIENWQNYRKGRTSFHEVGIKKQDSRTIFIKTNCDYNICFLLSNIELTPIYIRNGTVYPISSGAFCTRFNKDYKFKPNKFHPMAVKEILELVLVENLEKIKLFYEAGKIDVTPTTLYNDALLSSLHGDKIEKESRIHVSLFLNSENAKKNKDFLIELVKNHEFINVTNTEGYFFEKILQKGKCNNIPKFPVDLTFGVTNYYPNIENLSQLVTPKMIKEIPLHLTLQDYSSEAVDVIYMLHRPNIDSDYALLLSYITFIDERHIDDYIEILNDINITNPTKSEKIIINNFLRQYANLIPIGNVVHKYKVNVSSEYHFIIDENDGYFLSKKID